MNKIRLRTVSIVRKDVTLKNSKKFVQMYSDGEGDYTEERREKLKDLKEDMV